MKKAADDRTADIAYAPLICAGIIAIILAAQSKLNFTLRGALSYILFAITAFTIGILGFQRNALSRKTRGAVWVMALLCYLVVAWWLIIFYFFTGKPA